MTSFFSFMVKPSDALEFIWITVHSGLPFHGSDNRNEANQALYAAGWDESVLMNIVEVTAVFAMYNRIADGTGVIAENTKTTLTKKKLGSYIENLINFGLKVPEDLKGVE